MPSTVRIAVTMGDAAGIGPELILKAWKTGKIPSDALLIGDFAVLEWCNEKLGFNLPLSRIASLGESRPGRFEVLDAGRLRPGDFKIGAVDARSGDAAASYVETATRLALDGKIDAIVTLPINKEATRLSRPDFCGHTELIAGLCQQSDYTMLLTSDKLSVSHVSTHVSMAEALTHVRRERILTVISLTAKALMARREKPRLAVAGLNPHAGENGAFGREDMEQIRPAVEDARAMGYCCDGPLPPDTVFLKARDGDYDAVICMYHDQGHIPMKLIDFAGGVNVTLGLRVIRTSVDHGTALDIAYKNLASPQSLVAAYQLASDMARKRKEEASDAQT